MPVLYRGSAVPKGKCVGLQLLDRRHGVSNPAKVMDVRLFCLLVSGLCGELITRSEVSHRLCVSNFV